MGLGLRLVAKVVGRHGYVGLDLAMGFHTGRRPPRLDPSRRWYRAIDTSLSSGDDLAEPGEEIPVDPPDSYLANPRSTVVLLAR